MKVLVTFALESELAPWLRRREFARLANLDFPSFESSREELRVRVAITGVGPGRAQRVAREALRWQPDVCIAAGFAGGLKPAHHAGDVLAALAVRDAETNRSFACDPRIAGIAEECGARRIATLCTSAYAISTAEDKRRMSASADAVDMESFFILNEAHERGIRGVAIRAVSDAADKNLPLDFTQVLDDRGHVRIWRLAAKIARAPYQIPALIRLGFASRRGARHLAQVLESTIETLNGAPGLLAERVVETATA